MSDALKTTTPAAVSDFDDYKARASACEKAGDIWCPYVPAKKPEDFPGTTLSQGVRIMRFVGRVNGALGYAGDLNGDGYSDSFIGSQLPEGRSFRGVFYFGGADVFRVESPGNPVLNSAELAALSFRNYKSQNITLGRDVSVWPAYESGARTHRAESFSLYAFNPFGELPKDPPYLSVAISLGVYGGERFNLDQCEKSR